MTVQHFISLDPEPLAPDDAVGRALSRIADLDVEHLPVVGGQGELVALVSEEELLNLSDPTATLGSVGKFGVVSVRPGVHVFEAAALLAIHGLSALPVTDDEGVYLGLITRRAVFEEFTAILSASRSGAILVLELLPRDYSLSRISHLVEQSGGTVLSATTQTTREANDDPSALLRVGLKLDVTDTARIRHVLEHEGYHVAAVYNEDESETDFSLRVQEFMRYLEV